MKISGNLLLSNYSRCNRWNPWLQNNASSSNNPTLQNLRFNQGLDQESCAKPLRLNETESCIYLQDFPARKSSGEPKRSPMTLPNPEKNDPIMLPIKSGD